MCLFRGFEFEQWSAGIEYVSGALSKGGDKNHHNHSKMLIATHRTAATTTPNCNNMKITQDQAAFEAQKNLSTGCKTMTKIAHSGDFLGIRAIFLYFYLHMSEKSSTFALKLKINHF